VSCTDRAGSFPAAPILNFKGENSAVAPSVLTSSQVYAGQLRESACTTERGTCEGARAAESDGRRNFYVR
jgi:hypothetical protein